MKPSQCRAARALIGMSQEELATASNVAKRTIASFEKEDRQPYVRTIEALQSTLENYGVTFLDDDGQGAGVRAR